MSISSGVSLGAAPVSLHAPRATPPRAHTGLPPAVSPRATALRARNHATEQPATISDRRLCPCLAALARLLDNGHIASIKNVFGEGPGGGGRALSMFAAAGGAGRTANARSPRLVELKVSKGTSPSQLAAHVARMKDVEYAFVPPVRTLFARRAKAGADPLASRQWGHGAIRLGHARAAAGFKNATKITVAVVDSGIDPRHPDLKHVITEYKNFLSGSDKDFVGHGTHVAGVVVIAAMGNEYEEGNPTEYPAAMPEVCAVGATDELDKRAAFSNTGRHIDLVAPGVAILSTTPTFRYDGDGEREYDAWDGTSMATPHVAGAAALVLAKSPGLTPAQVIKKLTSSADRVAGAKKGSAASERAAVSKKSSPVCAVAPAPGWSRSRCPTRPTPRHGGRR